FFFFSSRRRHTRFSRDWSSDVCSSDLANRNLCVNRWRGGFGDRCFQCDEHAVSPNSEWHRPADPGALDKGNELADGSEILAVVRSEERRVGKGCRYAEATEHDKKRVDA